MRFADLISLLRRLRSCLAYEGDILMERTPPEVTGKARYDRKTRELTITTTYCKNDSTTRYFVELLDPHPDCGNPAVRLNRLTAGGSSDAAYDVIRTAHGLECSCAAFVFTYGNTAKGCKHCAATVQTELMRRAVPREGKT